MLARQSSRCRQIAIAQTTIFSAARRTYSTPNTMVQQLTLEVQVPIGGKPAKSMPNVFPFQSNIICSKCMYVVNICNTLHLTKYVQPGLKQYYNSQGPSAVQVLTSVQCAGSNVDSTAGSNAEGGSIECREQEPDETKAHTSMFFSYNTNTNNYKRVHLKNKRSKPAL